MKKCFNTLSEGERSHFLEEHFDYEVDMFFFALKKIMDPNKQKSSEITANINMALEDFLLHARNLLEFFYHACPKTDKRACAEHFFKNQKDWLKICPAKTDDIKKLENRVNGEVTHLGYNRFDGVSTEKLWNNVQLLHDFMNIVKIFINNAEEKYISQTLKTKYNP